VFPAFADRAPPLFEARDPRLCKSKIKSVHLGPVFRELRVTKIANYDVKNLTPNFEIEGVSICPNKVRT
jgi:hypothetical protein